MKSSFFARWNFPQLQEIGFPLGGQSPAKLRGNFLRTLGYHTAPALSRSTLVMKTIFLLRNRKYLSFGRRVPVQLRLQPEGGHLTLALHLDLAPLLRGVRRRQQLLGHTGRPFIISNRLLYSYTLNSCSRMCYDVERKVMSLRPAADEDFPAIFLSSNFSR